MGKALDTIDKVHLVGSVALGSVKEVFETAGSLLGTRLRSIPDGEPGSRRLWVGYQYPLLRASPYLQDPKVGGAFFPMLSLAEGVAPNDVQFGELGYAREARASYQELLEARKRGDVPASVKLQVCLPTPMSVIHAFCTPGDAPKIEPSYEAAMMREIKKICDYIPHHDLSLQWDFCFEMLFLDGQLPPQVMPQVGASKEEIMARMRRISSFVPDDVDLGIHLCYGDFDGRHWVEPIDAGKMVEMANALDKAIDHHLTYIHFPIPIKHTDSAFFEPFSGLSLATGTEIYLGLIHAADGIEGAKRRIAAARKFVPRFGLATECGISRAKTPAVVRDILKIHADASSAPS